MTTTPHLNLSDRGHAPAVVFVHGQPGLGADFDEVAALLVADHRVIALDRPGYGEAGDGAISMAQNAEVLGDEIEARSAAPATLVGHSYGGGIAALLTARRPDLVAGLVLVGSVGRENSVNIFDHVLAAPLVGETLSAAGLFALGRVLPKLRGLATRSPGDTFERLRASLPDSRYDEVASKRGRQVWRSFVHEQRALLSEIGDVEASLPSIAVPTVVITGSWDVVVPPAVAASIAAAIPGAELITVDRVGHFVPRDAPKVVANAVRRIETRSASARAQRDVGAAEHADSEAVERGGSEVNGYRCAEVPSDPDTETGENAEGARGA